MKFKAIAILFLIVCNFVIFSSFIFAQTEKSPQQFKLSEDKKSFPFKEGETIIAEVKFIGLDTDFQQDTDAGRAITFKSFLSALSWKKKEIVPNKKFNSEKVSDTLKFLKQWLASYGYLKAEVIALGEKLPKKQMNLIFSVKRNSPVLVSEIRFTGNKVFSESEYIQVMRDCLDGKNYYDKDHYNFCASKYVREFMFDKGYFKAKIGGINPKFVSDSYIVSFEVEEGIRYAFGDISIKGATVFSEKEIREFIGLNNGNIANATQIREGVYEKLKRLYFDKGYILYNAEFDVEFIEPQIEGQDGFVNIAIEIEEGSKFKVGKIEFIGIEQEQAEKLKESFPLKDDEIFNQTKLEEGIEKLNETEKFYPIDSARDVELRTSQTDRQIVNPTLKRLDELKLNTNLFKGDETVDIIIKLTKIE